ncbi:MAG: TonB-dependent receptor plug domain-containing protein [Bacteroidia bacterium]|nr:TonB-dependent receptor plug domain-containing protein [Bacteroidia bacterium]
MKYLPIRLFYILVIVSSVVNAQNVIQNDYFDMTLEDLMNVEVITASKKTQKSDEVPVPIYVITHEDLKIYGYNHVGEALKMVPGIEIIQGADHDYQVSIRGLSTTGYNVSNKVLFLINGRSVYNEIFGGVRMQSFNISIDEIERIEVVRGCASALYGANAFAGIVNIITRSPEKEKGIHAGLLYGSFNQIQGNVRYGGSLIQDKLFYKIGINYQQLEQAKARMQDIPANEKNTKEDLGYAVGSIQALNTKNINIGMTYRIKQDKKIDFAAGYSDNMADTYYTYPGEFSAKDYFVQVDYADSNNLVRAFYNGLHDTKYGVYRFLKKEKATHPYLMLMQRYEFYLVDPNNTPVGYQTLDIEYNRNIKIKDKIQWVLGASARSNFIQSVLFADDASRVFKNQYFGAAFTQLEYKPISALTLIGGIRADYNNVIGKNINPRVTALYQIDKNHSVRVGAGTATRNPHFFDLYLNTYLKVRNLQTATGLNPVLNLTANSNYVVLSAKGNPNLRSEQMLNFDLGYSAKLSKILQVKVDAFLNQLRYAIMFSKSEPISVIERIENIHGIFAAQGADVSNLIPNDMTLSEMQATIQTLQNQIDYLTANDPNNPNLPALIAVKNVLAGTPTQPGLISLYGIPKEVQTTMYNNRNTFNFWGGEISVFFIPTKKFSITANYAYLNTDPAYNRLSVPQGANPKLENFPVHKFNLGVKYQFSYVYSGVMFNYNSKIVYLLDNNKNGVYDLADIQQYNNQGIGTVEDRLNLNVNIGFRHKKFDFYVSGINLIQPNYQQLHITYSVDGGDMLNRRFCVGLRVDI